MNLTLFKEQMNLGKFSQSYIFEGDENFLDNLLEDFIQKVMNPENDFKILKEIEEKTHPDLLVINPEKNNISIDSIRNMIEYVQKRPLNSKYKLVIIKNAEYLRKESSNALLKTLEESLDYVVICIAVNSRYKLLETIRSRCVFVSQVDFSVKFNYEDYEELLKLISLALNGDFSCLYNSKNKEYLMSLKEDEKFLPILYEIFKEFYIFLEVKNENIDKNLLRIFRNNENFKKEKIEKILENIEMVRENLKNNVNFQLSIEKIFITILN